MSLHHMQLALDAQGLSSPEKFVLLIYCNNAQPDGSSWPSLQRIADETGLTDEEVYHARVSLALRGLLDFAPDLGLPIPNAVRLHLSAIEALRRPPREEEVDWGKSLEFTDEESVPKRTSVVYLIGAPGQAIAKIGVTKNLDNRLRGLRGSSAAPVEVLWSAPGDRKKEAWLHSQFEHLNSHGEWFDFGDLDPATVVAAKAAQYDGGAR